MSRSSLQDASEEDAETPPTVSAATLPTLPETPTYGEADRPPEEALPTRASKRRRLLAFDIPHPRSLLSFQIGRPGWTATAASFSSTTSTARPPGAVRTSGTAPAAARPSATPPTLRGPTGPGRAVPPRPGSWNASSWTRWVAPPPEARPSRVTLFLFVLALPVHSPFSGQRRAADRGAPPARAVPRRRPRAPARPPSPGTFAVRGPRGRSPSPLPSGFSAPRSSSCVGGTFSRASASRSTPAPCSTSVRPSST